MKEHTKNQRPSNHDKHTKKQKGPSNNKKYSMFGWIKLGGKKKS
jgi:hypothetical protein